MGPFNRCRFLFVVVFLLPWPHHLPARSRFIIFIHVYLYINFLDRLGHEEEASVFITHSPRARPQKSLERISPLLEMIFLHLSTVFKSRDIESGEICALKKIRMESEKEGVRLPLLPLSFPCSFFPPVLFSPSQFLLMPQSHGVVMGSCYMCVRA